MPHLTVNGESRATSGAKTVADLVHELGLSGKAVAVEINKKIVPRKNHQSTLLNDGDVVEVVTLVGGG